MRMRVDLEGCLKRIKMNKMSKYVLECFVEDLKNVIYGKSDLQDFADFYCLKERNK